MRVVGVCVIRLLSAPASIPRGDVPSRAELFWRDSDRLLRPFSSAGAAGADVTAAEAHREANGSAEWVLPLSLAPSPPHTIRRAESILDV